MCGNGVNGSMGAFQVLGLGSNPGFRTKFFVPVECAGVAYHSVEVKGRVRFSSPGPYGIIGSRTRRRFEPYAI